MTDFRPFAEYDCQGHTRFPSFSGTEKWAQVPRTVSAKEMVSLLLPLERHTRNTAGINFPTQVFTPRYRISEQGRMSVKIRKGCSAFSSLKHLPHHLLQWQGTGLLMLPALRVYLSIGNSLQYTFLETCVGKSYKVVGWPLLKIPSLHFQLSNFPGRVSYCEQSCFFCKNVIHSVCIAALSSYR